jgi:protein-S-isoprenylcysteine O-methyltransferase Ste14
MVWSHAVSATLLLCAERLSSGQWWVFYGYPALYSVALFIRTHLEDRMPVRELAGYAEYARRVRRRPVPAVW